MLEFCFCQTVKFQTLNILPIVLEIIIGTMKKILNETHLLSLTISKKYLFGIFLVSFFRLIHIHFLFHLSYTYILHMF